MTAVQNLSNLNQDLSQATCIVDCLLGTGAKVPLRDHYATAVASANRQNALRIAIDLPTGLDCDTGQVDREAFRADHTITFVAPKLGLVQPDSYRWVGQIHVVGIGVPLALLKRFEKSSL